MKANNISKSYVCLETVQTLSQGTMSQQDNRNQIWVTTEDLGLEGSFKGHLVHPHCNEQGQRPHNCMAQSWHSPIMQEGCRAMPEPLCTLQTQDCSIPLSRSLDLSTTPEIPPAAFPSQWSLLSRCATSACYLHMQAAIQQFILLTLMCLVVPGGSLRQRDPELFSSHQLWEPPSHHGKVPLARFWQTAQLTQVTLAASLTDATDAHT